MVEYNLAKVGVAGSNPVSRSFKSLYLRAFFIFVLQIVLHKLFEVGICPVCKPVLIAFDLPPVDLFNVLSDAHPLLTLCTDPGYSVRA